MNRSTPFLLISLLCLLGCGDGEIRTQSASLSTGHSEEFVSAPAYEHRTPDETDLEYLLRRGGVSPIVSEEGGGYYFSNSFDICREDELHLLSKVKGLRSFNMLDGNSFSPAGWKHIGQISSLETFKSQSSTITDAHLIGLHGLAHLRDLQIIMLGATGNPISDQGMQVLAGLPELCRLVLHSRDLNVRACELIGNCTQLRALELRGPVTNECLKPLGKLKNLRHLILQGTFSDEGLVYLAGLKHLERLVIQSDQLKGSGLIYFAHSSELRELGFSGSPEENATLKHLNQLKALVTLSLGSPTVNDALLLNMPDLPALNALSLRSSTITDAGLDALVKVKNLTELNLQFTDITNAGLTRLELLKQLRLLVIGNPVHPDFITGNGLALLSKLPKLETLDLSYVDTEKLDLRPLAQAASLLEVNLTFGSSNISNRWLDVQAQRPNLKRVEEIIPVSRRVSEFGIHTNEIP